MARSTGPAAAESYGLRALLIGNFELLFMDATLARLAPAALIEKLECNIEVFDTHGRLPEKNAGNSSRSDYPDRDA